MLPRLVAAAGMAAALLLTGPAVGAPLKQKVETCKFGADDQKLTGAARKAFMSKCLSDTDSPRGRQAVPKPNPQ
jgi:hypothetical protein